MNLSQNGQHPITCAALFLTDKVNQSLFVMERLVKTGLTQQQIANGEKCYCIPGGKVDWHENAKNAIIRESKEEIGIDIDIRNVKFTGLYSDDSWKHINTHCITLYFHCDIKDLTSSNKPVIMEPDKMSNPQWIPYTRILNNEIKLFCDCQDIFNKYYKMEYGLL